MQKKKNEKQNTKPKRVNKQKKEKRMRKYKIIKFILKVIILIGLIIGIIAYAFTSPVFNITKISVVGNNKFEEEDYIKLSGLSIGNNIFNFRKTNTINNIKTNSYVDNVKIRRKLPTEIEIQIEERTVSYLISLENEEFAYINSQGYILEKTKEKLPLTIITGILTSAERIVDGNRLDNEDLERLQDVIQIKDAIKNSGVNKEIDRVDVKSKNNYILTFETEAKEVQIGGVDDNLSSKILYMDYLLNEQEGIPGTIYLNQERVYFSPK